MGLRESRTHMAEEPAPAASPPPPNTASETRSVLSPRISHSYGGRAGTGGFAAASEYGFRDSLRALSENLALIWRKSRHRRLRRRLRIRFQRLTPCSLRESRTHMAEEPA